MNSGDVDVVVAEDSEAAARVVAELLADAARAGAAIALSGGTTPRRAYELAAALEPDWSRARLWWSDERCVPPEHEWSNFRLARETLIDRLARPPGHVYRIRGEDGSATAALAYDDELRQAGPLDLVLLGIGADGHVASLFPGAPALGERMRLAVAAQPALEPLVERVTLTVPALAAARQVVLFATGPGKADAVARALAPADAATPASLVRSSAGTTRVVADPEAAAGLPR